MFAWLRMRNEINYESRVETIAREVKVKSQDRVNSI